MKDVNILLIDDDEEIIDTVGSYLELKEYNVVSASTGMAGIDAFKKAPFDIVICDYLLPDTNGISVCENMISMNSECVLILITGHGTIEGAVKAIKIGVFDYILKPFDLNQFELALHKAVKELNLKKENLFLRNRLSKIEKIRTIIGKSQLMENLRNLILRIAPSSSTVLITGESGTGKELVARAIHDNSDRKDKPFIPVNCGAIPDNLLEDELFGHIKGAFTDALSDRKGKFESASEGTLFLDEIGNMSLHLQAKLLRVLQEKDITPLGSEKSISVDTRIITATNVDIKKQIEKGLFREDLFYRLNVIPIEVPPLRHRIEDIPVLIDHFINHFKDSYSFEPIILAPETLRQLMEYNWPGNVRQLENVIERITVLHSGIGPVLPSDLPEEISENNEGEVFNQFESGFDLKSLLEQIEERYIIKALEKANGRQNIAAKLIGLKRTTLLKKMQKYQLNSDTFKLKNR